MASPTVYGTPSATTFSATTPWTQSYTNTVTTQQNTAIFAWAQSANASPDTVKWNGTLMTNIYNGTAAINGSFKCWYLAAPATGTNNLVVDYVSVGARTGELIIWTFQDCAQSSPTDGALVTSSNASTTSDSNNFTTGTNNSAILTAEITINTSAYVANGSQVVIGTANVAGAHNAALSYLAVPTAGTQSTGWSWTTTSGSDLQIGAIKYVAPTGGATILNPTLPMLHAG